jgi:hypothetical protein
MKFITRAAVFLVLTFAASFAAAQAGLPAITSAPGPSGTQT